MQIYLIVYKCFDKKTTMLADKSALGGAVKLALSKESAKELHNPIVKKFENWKEHSPVIDTIWAVDLDDM